MSVGDRPGGPTAAKHTTRSRAGRGRGPVSGFRRQQVRSQAACSIEGGSPLQQPGNGKKDDDCPVKDDVIVSLTVKGSLKRVYTASDLREHLSLLPAGQEITIKYKRGKRSKRFKVTLADRGR